MLLARVLAVNLAGVYAPAALLLAAGIVIAPSGDLSPILQRTAPRPTPETGTLRVRRFRNGSNRT